jgi:hypothetical protein
MTDPRKQNKENEKNRILQCDDELLCQSQDKNVQKLGVTPSLIAESRLRNHRRS